MSDRISVELFMSQGIYSVCLFPLTRIIFVLAFKRRDLYAHSAFCTITSWSMFDQKKESLQTKGHVNMCTMLCYSVRPRI